jgi:L-iditol 2-dehydrogenase
VDEGFATSGYVLPRTPRPETSAAGLEAAKATAEDILKGYGPVDSDGFDVVMECTGVETCMQAAIHVSLCTEGEKPSRSLTVFDS